MVHLKKKRSIVTLLQQHEPAHGGYVGQGGLTAAVCGDVFASPSTEAVCAAIRHCAGPKGALLIVKNYTGDRLNFGLAAERCKGEGYRVEMIVVGEDAAIPSADVGMAGRRGLCGTVLVHKVAGAVAESGADLDSVLDAANHVASHMRTIGISLTSCNIPGAPADPSSAARLNHDEMEVGLGIHGEPGFKKEAFKGCQDAMERAVRLLMEERKGALDDSFDAGGGDDDSPTAPPPSTAPRAASTFG